MLYTPLSDGSGYFARKLQRATRKGLAAKLARYNADMVVPVPGKPTALLLAATCEEALDIEQVHARMHIARRCVGA